MLRLKSSEKLQCGVCYTPGLPQLPEPATKSVPGICTPAPVGCCPWGAIRSCLFCNGTYRESLHARAWITPRRQDTPAILLLNIAHFLHLQWTRMSKGKPEKCRPHCMVLLGIPFSGGTRAAGSQIPLGACFLREDGKQRRRSAGVDLTGTVGTCIRPSSTAHGLVLLCALKGW